MAMTLRLSGDEAEALRLTRRVIFLDLEALLHVGERTLGVPAVVRDHGLLESALARPQSTAFGEDAYAGIHEKAAALMHSLARNHALVDGNERLALAATIAFYGMNGLRLTLTNDDAYARPCVSPPVSSKTSGPSPPSSDAARHG